MIFLWSCYQAKSFRNDKSQIINFYSQLDNMSKLGSFSACFGFSFVGVRSQLAFDLLFKERLLCHVKSFCNDDVPVYLYGQARLHHPSTFNCKRLILPFVGVEINFSSTLPLVYLPCFQQGKSSDGDFRDLSATTWHQSTKNSATDKMGRFRRYAILLVL